MNNLEVSVHGYFRVFMFWLGIWALSIEYLSLVVRTEVVEWEKFLQPSVSVVP